MEGGGVTHDLIKYFLLGLFIGVFALSLFTKWRDHQKWMDKQKVTSIKPTKELTPELIQHRIVKAQWNTILYRLKDLTTIKKPLTGSMLSDISRSPIRRECTGALWLGVKQYGDSQQFNSQPIPLCMENYRKLVNLGFTRFTHDKLWAFYVEPDSVADF